MSRGHDRERAVAELLRQDDWFVVRAAGSLGDADLVACRLLSNGYAGPLAEVRVIEVKSDKHTPWAHFGPARRAAVSAAAVIAGATAWLAWWPPRGQLKWISESEWPS